MLQYKVNGRKVVILNADDEEPNCMQCTEPGPCNNCGPKYGWRFYRRTIDLKDLIKERLEVEDAYQ